MNEFIPFALLRNSKNERYVFGIGCDVSTILLDETDYIHICLYNEKMNYIGQIKVSNDGSIDDLEVYEDFRCEGYGKFLLELSVAFFKGNKLRCLQNDETIKSSYNNIVHNICTKMGFKIEISEFGYSYYKLDGNDFKPIYDLQNQNIDIDDVDIPNLKPSSKLTKTYLFKLD